MRRPSGAYCTGGTDTLSTVWLWMVRTVVLVAVGATVGLSFLDLTVPPL